MLLRKIYTVFDQIRHRARLRQWKQELAWGRRGEDLAHRYLQSKGLEVVERNWVGPGLRAEVDLIAWDGDTLVFVEVKSRRSTEYGDPERAMDRLKRQNIIRAARCFLRRWRLPEDNARFDLVAVVFEPFEIRHIADAWSFDDGRDSSGNFV